MYKALESFPPASFNSDDFPKLYGKSPLSIDIEWAANEKPTIVGLSDGITTVSTSFEEAYDHLRKILRDYPETEWIGHNAASADVPILEKMSIKIPLNKVLDTIVYHYLVNCHLCKGTGKTTEEMDDKRGRGWMNLGSMLSIYTDLAYYKECRGEMCRPELPCPEHNELYYNSIDAFGPAVALPKLKMQARLRGVDKLYSMHRELMYVLAQMREYGVKVDRPYVRELNAELLAEKEEIEKGLEFNPRSPKAVRDYFKTKHKLVLPDAQEETLRELIEEMEDEAPPELISLLDLKELGNGAERWFKEQYRDKNGWLQGYMDEAGFVHPHLGIFTSYGRMQCTSPNLQNAGKRRRSRKRCECGCALSEHTLRWLDGEKEKWACVKCGQCRHKTPEYLGKRVRRAIIAPEGWYILRADYCVAPETRVLTDDLRWVRAADLKEGDDLLAFDEKIGGYSTKFKKSRVLRKKEILRPTREIITDRGSVIASDEHLWVVRRHEKGRWKRYSWIATKDLRPGDSIAYFGKPWEEDHSKEAGYIAGLLDGEGTNSSGRRHRHVSFAQNDGIVLKTALSILRQKGFKCSVSKRKKARVVYFTGPDRPSLRALGTFRPKRLLKNAQKLWEGSRVWSGKTKPAKILDVKFLGANNKVVALGTSTKTLITEGFLGHNSNAENRVVLDFSGYKIARDVDLHTWVRDMAGLTEDMDISKREGSARDAAKTIQHGGNILEGLQLKTVEELRTARLKKEVETGARIVFPEWTFLKKVVTFTGANLAERCFGNKSWESRAKALAIAGKYFGRFPGVRDFQKRVSKQCETESEIGRAHV